MPPKRYIIKTSYITPAFSGAQKSAALLCNPRPSPRKKKLNLGWLHHPCLLGGGGGGLGVVGIAR